jgi:hypothetical protein
MNFKPDRLGSEEKADGWKALWSERTGIEVAE